MKINSINTQNKVNFGYDKEANLRLKARCQQASGIGVVDVLNRANNECNYIENQIVRLEGKNRCNIDENESQINMLVNHFVEMKRFVCLTAERLFPDINFLKSNYDYYDIASDKQEPAETEFQNPRDINSPRVAYIWRDLIADELGEEIENLAIRDMGMEEDSDDNEDEVYGEYIREISGTDNKNTKGSGLVEKFIPLPNSPKSLDDVVGLDTIRDDIKELIIFPIEHPQEAEQRKLDYDIDVPHFIVFHGPPGCGKTMMAQAIAQETGCDMHTLDVSKVGSSYINETSKNIKAAFEFIKDEAKKSPKPVILFLDEMDSMFSKRSEDNSGGSKEDNKMINSLLTLTTEAKENNIIIIGATNMFDIIDPAAKRRIDMNAYVGLPNKEEITKLLKMRLEKFEKGKALAQDEKALEEISSELLGHSPSNIVNIVKASSKLAYKARKDVSKEDIQKAVAQSSWEKVKEKEYKPENKQRAKIGFGR